MTQRSPILPIAAFVLVALGLMGLWALSGPHGEAPAAIAPQPAVAPTAAGASQDVPEDVPQDVPQDMGAKRETTPITKATAGLRALAEETSSATWIRGTVHRSDDRRPIGGVRVAVLPRHGPKLAQAEILAQSTSSADGAFELAGSLEPVHWRLGHGPLGGALVAEHPGFAPAQHHFDAQSMRPIQTSLLLEPAAVLAGRLLDPDGEPVADALVLCGWLAWAGGEGAPKGLILPSDTTDSRGRFRLAFVRTGLDLLEPDDVQLALRFEHGALGHGHRALPPSTAATLRTSVGQRDVELGDMSFPLAEGETSFVVTLRDPEGEPLAGMDFELVGTGGRSFYRRAQTDRLGRTHWTAPRGAEFTLRQIVRPSNVQPIRPERTLVVDEAGVASGPALDPWPIRRLRVRMLDAAGLAVEGATVGVDDGVPPVLPFESALRTAPTDAEGWTADMPVLATAQATVIGTRASGGIARSDVEIPKTPHLTAVELRMEPDLGTLVRVHTGAPLGKAPNGVALHVVDASSGTVLQTGARSVASNVLELRLPRGNYRVEVERAPPWLLPPPSGVPFVVQGGVDVDVQVPLVRAALLVLVPVDPAARTSLRQDVKLVGVGPGDAPDTKALRAPRVGAESLDPRFTFAPRKDAIPQLAHPVALRLEPGRWALWWRVGHGKRAEDVWIGEVEVAHNMPVRVDLGAPAAPLVGRHLELRLERR